MRHPFLSLVLLVGLLAGLAFANTMTYIESQEVTVIDPALHTDESSLHAVLNIYDPLVYPKVQEGLMEPGPHLAESWTVSEDGTVYTFTLRDDVVFHDGSVMNADDVVYSVQRLMGIQKGFSWLFAGVVEAENVVALDDRTVQFTLNNAYAPFVPSLTQLFIVNADLVRANEVDGDWGQAFLRENDAGSGPYIPVRYQRATILELDAFEDYWRGWSEGQVTHVLYRVVEEEATVRTLLASGDADMIDQWQTPRTYDQLATIDGITVDRQASAQLFHVPLNTARAPLDNLDFRKALVHAFDFETAQDAILGGAAPAQGPVPVSTWRAFGREPVAEPYAQDLEAARGFLEASGVDPSTVELDYVFPEGGNRQRQVGLLLQSNLAELGISVRLQEVPWARIVELSSSADTTPDMAAIFDTLKYPHPDSHLFGMYHPSALGSYRTISRYDVPEVSALLEQAREEVDLDRQLDLYQEADQMITEDYPSLFVGIPVHTIAFADHVQGYSYVGLLGYDVAFYDFTFAE